MHAEGVFRRRLIRLQTWVAIAACLWISPAVYGQNVIRTRVTVRGEVYNAPPTDWLEVQLVASEASGAPFSANLSQTGTFQFDSVQPGEYTLRVTDSYGHTVYECPVAISGPNDELAIRLPKRNVEEPVAGTVSVRELRGKVAPKALKLYRKGATAFRKRDFNAAREYFQQAIAADPSFASAYNELGATLYQLHQSEEASAEFSKAAQLDPDSPMMAYNLALSLLSLGRYPDAETAARTALKLDPNQTQAHFVLGFSLYKEQRQDKEAVDNLQWAAKQYPRAHLLAAEILTRLARKLEAAGELRKYLRSDDTLADRPKVQAWLAALEKSPQSPAPGDEPFKTPAGRTSAAP